MERVQPSDPRRRPTVVVARRPRPGRESAFEQWLRALVTEAGHADGYLGAELQPPNAQHPDEWVTVYQFLDADRLEAWLRSPSRAALLADGEDLTDGAAREQVLAVASEDVHVTVVSSYRVLPDRRERFDAFAHRVVEALGEYEGFVSADVFEPVAGLQEDAVIVVAFTARRHLDAWLASDRRRALLAEIEPHLAQDRVTNVVGGFGGWFPREGPHEVRRWKQAALVLLALYPTSLLLTVVRDALLPDLSLVPAVFLANAAGVAILSWLLMPWLTRTLDGWLRR